MAKATSRKAAAPQNVGKAKSGGGPRGNKVVQKPLKVGERAVDVIPPSGSERFLANDPRTSKTMSFGGKDDATDLGNYKAERCGQGPGGGRTVYPSGYQALHGKPVQGERDERDIPMGKVANK